MVKHKLWGQRLSPTAGKKLLVPLQAVGGVPGEQLLSKNLSYQTVN